LTQTLGSRVWSPRDCTSGRTTVLRGGRFAYRGRAARSTCAGWGQQEPRTARPTTNVCRTRRCPPAGKRKGIVECAAETGCTWVGSRPRTPSLHREPAGTQGVRPGCPGRISMGWDGWRPRQLDLSPRYVRPARQRPRGQGGGAITSPATRSHKGAADYAARVNLVRLTYLRRYAGSQGGYRPIPRHERERLPASTDVRWESAHCPSRETGTSADCLPIGRATQVAEPLTRQPQSGIVNPHIRLTDILSCTGWR
jgi:hypothetical protein